MTTEEKKTVEEVPQEEAPKSPVLYVKLNSSLGSILGVCVPKQFQVNLKEVVVTAYNEKSPYITIIVYDPESETAQDVINSVIENKKDIVLLSIHDFFAQQDQEQTPATDEEVKDQSA
jgi:hypothetical protein